MPVVDLDTSILRRRICPLYRPLFVHQADESYRKTESKEGKGKGKGKGKVDRRGESAGTGQPAGSDFVLWPRSSSLGGFLCPPTLPRGRSNLGMYIFRRRTCHSIISLSARNADEEQVLV